MLNDIKSQINFLSIFDRDYKHHCLLIPSLYAMDNCRILLEYFANVDTKNCHGLTPLHLATRNRDTECLRTLLEMNADASATSNDGLTPLQYAERKGYKDKNWDK